MKWQLVLDTELYKTGEKVMCEHKIITIDGPAGAGKSTIAKAIASKLGILYLDTGAMYRALALHFTDKNIHADDVEKVENALKNVLIDVKYINGSQKTYVNGQDVTNKIRTPEIGQAASAFSAIPAVRLYLVNIQRKIGEEQSFVIDGRDIGTYVFPKAKHKFYLTASTKERAKRRHKELIEKGIQKELDEIEKEISQRDYNDMNRAFAPLKQADDAILVDSTQYGIDEVVSNLLKQIEQ